jgi:hypothetical protein
MSRKRYVAAIAAVLITIAPSPAHAGEEHCAVRVVGQRPSGEYITTAPECRSSYATALAAVGVLGAKNLHAGATSQQLRTFATTTNSTIGTHYDGLGLTGSSFSVVGADCTGGWLNLSTTWKNRVSSTANGCPRIRHWDGDNLTGAWQDTLFGGGNLSSLDNKTNSIQYFGS